MIISCTQLPEEDDAHAGDGGGGSTAQVMGLEQEVDIRAELNAFSARHRQQTVVVQDGVQGLHPLWVDIAVAHDPRTHLYREKERVNESEREKNQYGGKAIAFEGGVCVCASP